jgi:hypothetical protein
MVGADAPTLGAETAITILLAKANWTKSIFSGCYVLYPDGNPA